MWQRDAAADTGAKTPTWGFSSSPLVLDDLVVVAASGSLIAYDAATGERRWVGPPAGGASYSSPQLVTLGGVPQILLVSATGLTSVSPDDGKMLWHHPWEGYPIVQPALTPEGDVLISVGQDSGTRRIGVTHGPAAWTTAERWTTNGLKAYFNDFVVHEGYAYGIDGRLVACIDLAERRAQVEGRPLRRRPARPAARPGPPPRARRAGRAGAGEGGARTSSPRSRRSRPSRARRGTTPVLVGDVLLVRNDREMAAFRLATEGAIGYEVTPAVVRCAMSASSSLRRRARISS